MIFRNAESRISESRIEEPIPKSLLPNSARVSWTFGMPRRIVTSSWKTSAASWQYGSNGYFVAPPATGPGGPFNSTTLPSGSLMYIEGPSPSAP